MRRLALVLALTLAACGVESASGAVTPPVRATLTPASTCAADSLCYVLAWPSVSDANGAADHYHVRVTSSAGFALDDTVTVTSLRFAIPRPAAGSSVIITASVWSIRRGLRSATAATASTTARTTDVPPPAPGSVTITRDSLAAAALPGVHNLAYAVALVTSDSTATVIGGSPVMHWCQPLDVHAGTTYTPGDTTWVVTLVDRGG